MIPAHASERQRLLALDLMRGVAALMVAFGHAGFLPNHYGATFSMCVAFFFILSGYVLTHAYGTELRKPGFDSVRAFLVIRLARLYPLHIVTWAIVFAVIVHFGV